MEGGAILKGEGFLTVRRQEIKGLLVKEGGPITGSELAHLLGVSRQVIVQDVAILRAKGEQILATPQGYLLPDTKGPQLLQCTLACQHGEDQVADELMTMIQLGARIIDVMVEHPLYGELRGLLMLQNRRDVEEFLLLMEREKARLLSSLTAGVHLHTLEVLNEEVLEHLKDALAQKGYLVE